MFNYNSPLDVRGTFLDISKTFDKVWYERLIFQIKWKTREFNAGLLTLTIMFMFMFMCALFRFGVI